MYAHAKTPTHLTMTLDVGLVAHVQAKLVAKLVPSPVVRVVAVSHGVKVEPAGRCRCRCRSDQRNTATTHARRRQMVQTSKGKVGAASSR